MRTDKSKNFGFLLKDLSHRYTRRFEERASAISLTLTQCRALVKLEESEGISQARLAELIEVEPMTMVRILDRMELDGLIERRPNPNDRRARCLFLTKSAKTPILEIWRLAELTRAEMFSGVRKDDRQTFLRVLEQLHANASAFEHRPIEVAHTAVATVTAIKTSKSCAERSTDHHG